MSRLIWGETGKRFYETGVDRGVFWKMDDTGKYGAGMAWSGLTSVTESPEGAEEEAFYADNAKYLALRGAEDLGFSIGAFYSPEEFDECDGAAELAPGVSIRQQTRKTFAFSYRSKIGNDAAKEDYGYKIHIYYGCSASPTEREHTTINDTPEISELSWDCTTTPINVEGYRPTSVLEIDSTKISKENLALIEDALYGTAESESKLLMPLEILTLIGADSSPAQG